MATHHVKEHEITAHQIIDVRPLTSGGQMVGPDQGLRLVLQDGQSHKWISESGGTTPSAGSWLVIDSILKTSVIVDAATFATLFTQA